MNKTAFDYRDWLKEIDAEDDGIDARNKAEWYLEREGVIRKCLSDSYRVSVIASARPYYILYFNGSAFRVVLMS